MTSKGTSCKVVEGIVRTRVRSSSEGSAPGLTNSKIGSLQDDSPAMSARLTDAGDNVLIPGEAKC